MVRTNYCDPTFFFLSFFLSFFPSFFRLSCFTSTDCLLQRDSFITHEETVTQYKTDWSVFAWSRISGDSKFSVSSLMKGLMRGRQSLWHIYLLQGGMLVRYISMCRLRLLIVTSGYVRCD